LADNWKARQLTEIESAGETFWHSQQVSVVLVPIAEFEGISPALHLGISGWPMSPSPHPWPKCNELAPQTQRIAIGSESSLEFGCSLL
jgi:hypothetical protein